MLVFPESQLQLYEATFGRQQNKQNIANHSKVAFGDFAEGFCLFCYFACFAIRIFILKKTGKRLLQNGEVLQQPPNLENDAYHSQMVRDLDFGGSRMD